MRNKLYRIVLMLLCCTFAFTFVACDHVNPSNINDPVIDNLNPTTHLQSFERDPIDFSTVKFTPWDTEKAAATLEKRAPKPYTIMVYMNGSDLESNIGAATIDLIEMLNSGLKSQNANIIVFTGGAKKWLNNVVPSDTCVIWELADGYIHELADIGLKNMGDPGTLAGFIDFSVNNFPSEKYGLIFWDHGGGSIAGFGSDEKFKNSNLTLMDLNCAFEKSELKNTKLEFIGFDACLMATVEMSVIASKYAKYMIASEDLEPGDGWDYSFLSALNSNPSISGADLGKIIVDRFFNFYNNYSYVDLTLSVIALENSNKVMHAMGELMKMCSESLTLDKTAAFSNLSHKRYATKTFGDASPINNYVDMVDLGDMAKNLKNDYPAEASLLFAALENCIVYNRHNSEINLSGLNAYYVFGGKSTGTQSLAIYSDLKMDPNYTAYLYDFFGALTGTNQTRFTSNKEAIRTDLTLWSPFPDGNDDYIMTGIINDIDGESFLNRINDLKVPNINRFAVAMFEISNSGKGRLLSVPISMNNENSELVVLLNNEFPDGKILGVRKEEGFKIQKGYDKISIGDKIAFYYKTSKEIDANENSRQNWHKTNDFTVENDLAINWTSISETNSYCSIMTTDIQNNKSFTEIKPLHIMKQAS